MPDTADTPAIDRRIATAADLEAQNFMRQAATIAARYTDLAKVITRLAQEAGTKQGFIDRVEYTYAAARIADEINTTAMNTNLGGLIRAAHNTDLYHATGQ